MKTSSSSLQDKYKIIESTFGQDRVKYNEELKYHTFSKLGGPAEVFYIATSQRELTNILDASFELKLPYFIFGSGTKILVSDKGMSGLVIRNRTSLVKVSGFKGKVGRSGLGIEEALVEVDSGVSVNKLNQFLEEQNLAPIVGISSAHATLGGSIFLDPQIQNLTQSLKVWEKGDVFSIEIPDLKKYGMVVLSAILKIKAK